MKEILEILKDKISKKQIVAILSIWLMKDIQSHPYLVVGCMTIISLATILTQWNIDKEKPNVPEIECTTYSGDSLVPDDRMQRSPDVASDATGDENVSD